MKKSEKKLFELLKKLCKGTGHVICPVGKLAKMTDLCEKSIRLASAALEKAGMIKKMIRHVPDHRTGKLKQIANQYIMIDQLNGGDFTPGGGGKNTGQIFKRFKNIKDQKIKREEEKNSPVHIQPDKPVQKTHAPLPASSKVSLDLFQALSSNYQAPVLEYVRQAFEVRYQQGLIGVPSKWIPAALENEQAKFDRTGRVGFPDRKSRRHHKSKRPQVTIAEDHNEQMAQERLLEIMEKAAAYEKDRQKRAV